MAWLAVANVTIEAPSAGELFGRGKGERATAREPPRGGASVVMRRLEPDITVAGHIALAAKPTRAGEHIFP